MNSLLKLIREVCLKTASAEFSCWPAVYLKNREAGFQKSPLEGHCPAVSCIVRVAMGGDIVGGRVDGVTHFWNRLPNGKEVDLTSCQFGGDGFTPFKRGRKIKLPALTDPRCLLFAKAVIMQLESKQ